MVFALARRMTHQQLLLNLDATTLGEAAIVAMDYEASYTTAHRRQLSIARPIYRTHVLQQQRVFILRVTRSPYRARSAAWCQIALFGGAKGPQ